MRSTSLAFVACVTVSTLGIDAAAQQPPPQQPPQQQPPPGWQPPPQQQQQPPPGWQPPPQQQQQPPPGWQPPPPQQQQPPPGWQPPPQQQQQPPPGWQPQQQPPPGWQQPPPGYGPQQPFQPPPPPPKSDSRGASEMPFLYGMSIGYGVGTGIWVDGIFKISDPGLAVISPLILGAAAPIGVYFWDEAGPFHRGVPSSMATGLGLGAVEGLAISGVHWQATGNGPITSKSFQSYTTLTFVMATGGGAGGFFFGEWLRPDPRSLGFIASGAGWGAISGGLFGIGVSGRDWKDGASIAGLVGYNAGIVTTGALSTVWVPSWTSQKYMWLGHLAGSAVGSLVFVAYLFTEDDAKHGFIGTSVGGLAGLGLAAAFTANMKDDDSGPPATGPQKARLFTPPFQLGLAPVPGIPGSPGAGKIQGTMLSAFGDF